MTARSRNTSTSGATETEQYQADKANMGAADDEKLHKKRRRKFRSGISHQQQRIAAMTIVLLTFMVLTSMITTPHNQMSPPILRGGASDLYTELISNSILPNETDASREDEVEKPPRDYGTCIMTPAVVPEHQIQSTFTASYPGSGAKMTWKLIEALSGFVTGDDFQLNGHANIVSIKTHFPSHEGREIPDSHLVQRAILLIRHPINAIPSYFNYLYEMENHLENHSTRAPLEAWQQWRDNNFDRQLQVWRRHTEHWMDKYSKMNRLVIGYERLTDDQLGPGEAKRLGEFLSRSAGVTIRPAEEVPCVWHTVVKYKQAQKHRRLQEVANPPPPPSSPGPNPDIQGSASTEAAGEDKPSWEGVPKLLQEFVADQRDQRLAEKGLLENLGIDPSNQQAQSAPGVPQETIAQQSPPQAAQQTTQVQPAAQPQQPIQAVAMTNQVATPQQAASAPLQVGQPGTPQQPMQAGQQIVQPVQQQPQQVQSVQQESIAQAVPPAQMASPVQAMATQAGPGVGQIGQVSQPGQTVPQPGLAAPQPGQTVPQPGQTVPQPGQTVSQPGQTVPQPGQTVPQPGQTVPQPGQAVPQPGQAVPQQVQPTQGVQQGQVPQPAQLVQPAPGMQVAGTVAQVVQQEGQPQQVGSVLDPSNPQSKRGGPKYIAPYTPRQLNDMIQVLTNLLERYRDDRAIAPILVQYIDIVATRSEGPPEDANTIVEQT